MQGTKKPYFPSFWQLQIGGWVGFYLLVVAVSLPYWNQDGKALFRENVWFVGSLFVSSCILRPIFRRLMRRQVSWIVLEAWGLSLSVLLAAAVAIAPDPDVWTLKGIDWAQWLVDWLQAAVMLVLWCNLYFGIKQWQQSAMERGRLLRAEAQAREARFSALRYQLNPHFLFNSLNAVSTLVLEGNASAATKMLSQISEFLRTTLSRDLVTEVPLSSEIGFAEQYLAIEQTRLGDRLRVNIAIAPETLEALVPDMLLQPLVENAIQHGITSLVEGGKIAISSRVRDSKLQITVRNSAACRRGEEDGVRESVSGNGNRNGIGLANTAERLKTLYGVDHRFALEWPEEGACEVTVELPFKKTEGGSNARVDRR